MSTKEKIIEAATRLFAEKGYEGMTMKLIGDEVGITPPAVYAFFKGKEDVFLHIYKGVLKDHLQLALNTAKNSPKKTAKKLLSELLVQVIEFQLKEAMQMKIYIRLLLFPPDFLEEDIKSQIRELVKQEHAMLTDIIERGMQNGEIKEGDSRALASLLICIMDGLFWQMQRYDEETFKEQFDVVWNQFWEGIKK